MTATDLPPGASPTGPRVRASALPAEARRRAIVTAALPLLIEHGPAVTTRQIAEAAGVAEGTIFRVFPDKDALIDAVVDAALDPAPVEAALAAIDPTAPLDAALALAVDALRTRAEAVWRLVSNVGYARPPDQRDEVRRRHLAELPGLVAVFTAHAGELRFDPRDAARRLRALAIAGSHPALVGDRPLTTSEIVDQFLDGARRGRT